jgi:hypothetical protein
MGTCNFWTMDDFDLYVIDDETLVRNYLGDDFVNEEIESYDIDLAWDMLLGDLESEFDDLKSHLEWYKIELKSGYYEGAQFYISTDYLGIDERADWLPSKPLIWDDEECELQFGLTKEETKKMIENEKKLINQFLEESKDYGFFKIGCVGVFSNGEAVYELA